MCLVLPSLFQVIANYQTLKWACRPFRSAKINLQRRWKPHNRTHKDLMILNGIIGCETVIPPGEWLFVWDERLDGNKKPRPNHPVPPRAILCCNINYKRIALGILWPGFPLLPLLDSPLRWHVLIRGLRHMHKVIYELLGFVLDF